MPSVAQITALLEFTGSIAGGGRWATGLWCTTDTFPSDPQAGCQSAATGAAAAFSALWQNGVGAFNATDTNFLAASCRLYAAGATASTAVAQAATPAADAGTGFGSSAASTSCVVTLQSPQAGRSGRGRMYMPATAATGLNAELHQFLAANMTALMPALVTFFIAIEALSLDDSHVLTPVVRSPKMNTVHPFKRFSVDTRPDRQEHRERGIVFSKRTSAFA